ncbi:MAG: 30S ribosomal protein S19e [Thermoplasmata archaeon]
MSHALDVPPAVLLPKLAGELKSRGSVAPPSWAAFIKTGVHKEKAPSEADWWFLRSASVLRKIHLKGPIGVEHLAEEYGGRRDRGSAPYHARTGSRSIAREIVQQLTSSGLVRSEKNRGRRLTGEGQKLLDGVARAALQGLIAQQPELAKYL